MNGPVMVIAPVHPLVSGAAKFNGAMVHSLSQLTDVLPLSYRRLYPPVIHRRDEEDMVSRPGLTVDAPRLLDWADPRTWREAVRLMHEAHVSAVVLPWLHPVMAPPYLWLLRHAPRDATKVIICHNVHPHHRVMGERSAIRSVLSLADLLVVHAQAQLAELDALNLRHIPAAKAFHPVFNAAELGELPSEQAVYNERARQGNPDISLLTFGAVRPYKGVDLALEALGHIPNHVKVRLTVAGAFWHGTAQLQAKADELGVADRVELIDGYQSDETAALLFTAATCSLLPYRSATQSGVVALSFTYDTPVIATAVGGLTESVADGRDGFLCKPDDPGALARAVQHLPGQLEKLTAGARRARETHTFDSYARLLLENISVR
jgi:glycosyltransferase involved in cell wall biosynthesis